MKKLISIFAIFTLLVTALPVTGSFDVLAASPMPKIVSISATSTAHSVKLSWKRLSKKNQKKVSGIAIFKNGEVIKRIGKTSSSYTDVGLSSGTEYKYQVKTFKATKKKQWYNKKTKKWQIKKPAKKYRGKSQKKNVYKYSLSDGKSVKTSELINPSANPNIPSHFSAPVIYSYRGMGDNFQNPTSALYWYGVPESEKYKIYKGSELIGETADCFFFDEDVAWGNTYSYKVSSVRGNEELFSKAVSITIPNKPDPDPKPPLSADDGVYLDCSQMYAMVNEFRQNPANQWYYDSGNEVVYVDSSALVFLERDEKLEQIAKQRAKEQWMVYYDPNVEEDRAHRRPDGLSAFVTVREMGMNPIAECTANCANTQFNQRDVVFGTPNSQTVEDFANALKNGDHVFSGWAETAQDYYNQGHRRALLSTGKHVKKIGLAGFRVKNTEVYALEFAY